MAMDGNKPYNGRLPLRHAPARGRARRLRRREISFVAQVANRPRRSAAHRRVSREEFSTFMWADLRTWLTLSHAKEWGVALTARDTSSSGQGFDGTDTDLVVCMPRPV